MSSEEITATTHTPDEAALEFHQDLEFDLWPFQNLERFLFFIGTLITLIVMQHLILYLTDKENTFQVVLTGTCEKELSITCPRWKPECAGTLLVLYVAEI